MLMIDVLRPGLLDAIIAIEPIIFSPEYLQSLYGDDRPPTSFEPTDNPMARGALKRRSVFSSRREALESFLNKAFFKTWRTEGLELYVDYGLQETRNGNTGKVEYRLKCAPEQEAVGCDIYFFFW
jgi:hypothetical protein